MAGPSAYTQVDSDEESFDPYLQPEWCTEDEYTPKEIKQHEKVERKRLEREANTPLPPLRATGSMGKTKYLQGKAKKPESKSVSTSSKFGALDETDYRKLPWFTTNNTPKVKKTRVNPKDYISLDEYDARRRNENLSYLDSKDNFGLHGSICSRARKRAYCISLTAPKR
jgi:hypothetical protein